jgi:hypothetical protein
MYVFFVLSQVDDDDDAAESISNQQSLKTCYYTLHFNL